MDRLAADHVKTRGRRSRPSARLRALPQVPAVTDAGRQARRRSLRLSGTRPIRPLVRVIHRLFPKVCVREDSQTPAVTIAGGLWRRHRAPPRTGRRRLPPLSSTAP